MTRTESITLDRLSIERGWIVGVAAVAIVLGVVGILFPEASLLTVALLFGIHLIVSGMFRLSVALTANRLRRPFRWLTALLAGLIVVAGVLCLANPWVSLTALGLAIGAGWVFEGLATLLAAASVERLNRWLTLAAAVVALVAGVLMMVFPFLGVATFVQVGAVLLIALGVATLLLFPRQPHARMNAAR